MNLSPELWGMIALAGVMLLREVQHRRGQQSTPVLDLVQSLLMAFNAKQAAAANMAQIANAAADNPELREVLTRTLAEKMSPTASA